MQRVEPAARLVHTLADEVGREASLKLLPVLEWVVPLRVGHRPRVEPDIDQLRYSAHSATALAAQLDLVNERPVEVRQRLNLRPVHRLAGQLVQ